MSKEFEILPSPAQTALERAKEINLERCQKELKAKNFQSGDQSSKIVKDRRVVTVCKLSHEAKKDYPECSHTNEFILDRTILKPEQHLRILSQPRKVIFFVL